ncbi:T9SS type A sorting domain-containing protein [Membranicola marinus]|uniref:T9SS type A sorting domain-containing protein n=1 Tax=Membranihabitans marinus TaxID=1227546 RepID=A0A953HQH1_9BACT|nr:T9SS type A sorting domain-containing protein [Membranihabitans marinus]MBY5959902.1 T9SS type A sorting domain-containing protein [Membranihabitans marinus]
MKKTLLITFFTLMITVLFSQTGFSVYPMDASIDVENPDSEYVTQGYVVNESDAELTLKWVKKAQSKPEMAEAAICDNVVCWNPSKFESEFSIAARDSSNFDFHYYPNGQAGSAVYKISVAEVDQLDNKAEMTFTINDAATTLAPMAGQEEVRIYPNPATEYFSVDGVDKLKEVIVINLVGQEVKRFKASHKAKYNVSELIRGLYLIRLIDDKEQVIKTVRLSKR